MNSLSFAYFRQTIQFCFLTIILGVLLMSLKAEAIENSVSIPQNRQVILDSSFYKHPTWIPSEADKNRVLNAIYDFLNDGWKDTDSLRPKSDAKRIEFIKQNISKLAVQFHGIGPEGERKIWCNFFPVAAHVDWKEKTVYSNKRDDPLYWNIEYSLEIDACLEFRYHWVKL